MVQVAVFQVAEVRVAIARLTSALPAFETLHNLLPSRRVGVGFSQGAALLSAALLSGELCVEGVAMLAGFIVRPPAVSLACRPRIFIGHGIKDEVVSVERARKGVATLRALNLDVVYVEDDVGHKVGITSTRTLKGWIEGVLA